MNRFVPSALAVALLVAGCGRSAAQLAPGAPTPDSQASGGDGGYRRPPQARAAARAADGVVTLSGQALPGSVVRLASPDGRHQEAPADAMGAWTLTAPPGAPAIFGLSQLAEGRRDQAQGYLAILPAGSLVAVELRAGAGSVVLAGDKGPPRLLAVDLDASGVAVVSGWAQPGQALRVLVDGTLAEEGVANPSGRFSLPLPKPLPAGARVVQVVSPSGAAQATVQATPPTTFPGVLRATPQGAGWRLDWRTPVGGVQTTELFGPEAGA